MSDTTLKAVLIGQDRSMGRTFRQAGDEADTTGRKVGGLGSKLSRLAGPASIAVGALATAGAAVVGVGALTVSAASDQNETLNKSSVIFGKNAAAIEEWGSTAWKNLGLSKTQAVGAAASFGDMFQQLGFAGNKATDMSKAVVEMSADLGSFNNLPTAEVADMISAAFRGEYDSLQRLIPNINASRVETEALGMTHKKTAKELTAAEKAAATLAIVQRDGARASGDFARTSDGLANQQKILAAKFEDTKAKIGTAFLPMLTKLGGWLIEKGVPALERFGGWISDRLWPALKEGYQTIMPGVRDALAILTGGVDGGTVSWSKIAEVITEKVIPFLGLLFRVYLPYVATQVRVLIEVVKALWKVFVFLRDVVARVTSFMLDKFADLARTYAGMLRGLSKVPGFGWAKDAADKLDGAASKASTLSRNIGNIPRNVPVTVTVSTRQLGGRIRLPNGDYYNPGQRAGGGPMIKGSTYLVGENGPELVTAGETSHVTPARQTAKVLAGGSGRGTAGGAGGSERPIVVQLVADGRILQEVLLRRKRDSGGALGLA